MKKLIIGATYKVKKSFDKNKSIQSRDSMYALNYNMPIYPAYTQWILVSEHKYFVEIKNSIKSYFISNKDFINNFRKCRKTSAKASEEILEAINKQMEQISKKPLLMMGQPSKTVYNNEDGKQWITGGKIITGTPSSNEVYITLPQPIEQISMTVSLSPEVIRPKTRFELIED